MGREADVYFDNLTVAAQQNLIVQARDYYPFGMVMADRSYESEAYRYGFNGKEKDDEWQGEGNSQDYEFRTYDPRLGRFLSIDPLAAKYPWYTPYQFAGNKPIWAVDVDGLEDAIFTTVQDLNGNSSSSLQELETAGPMGQGVLHISMQYHGNLSDPETSSWDGLARTRLSSYTFIRPVTIYSNGDNNYFDEALNVNFSLEVGPNITGRFRLLGFGFGEEIGVTGEMLSAGVQIDSRLNDWRFDPNNGFKDGYLKFALGADAAFLTGTGEVAFGLDQFSPTIADAKLEGGMIIFKAESSASVPKPRGRLELLSVSLGPGFFKLKAKVSTPNFNLDQVDHNNSFDMDRINVMPSDNTRVE